MHNRFRRILLIGRNGQVGYEFLAALAPIGNFRAPDRSELDLTDTDAIRKYVRDYRPDLIVNAAAYTSVDRAESEPDAAMAINGIAPGVLAEEARRINALLVHYSTDYVFDGKKSTPYTEEDIPNPLSVYGKTKLAGERAIQDASPDYYVLRTSWVYASRRSNFLNTILRLARERDELRIVDDQIGAPTWAHAIAQMTVTLLSSPHGQPGVYHLTASGAVTWFGFASALLAEVQNLTGRHIPRLLPITTAEYPLPAQRPANSRLDNSKLTAVFGIRPASWEAMLRECLRNHPLS